MGQKDRREGRVLGGLATVCRLVVGVGNLKDTATSAEIDFARTPRQGKVGMSTAEVAGYDAVPLVIPAAP
jgi:hypothetical protein